MKAISKQKLVCTCFLLVFFTVLQAEASEKAFQRIELNYGISLEIPKSWEVASENVKSSLLSAIEELMEGNERHPRKNGKHELLFTAFDSSESYKAIASVIVTPLDATNRFTQANLAFATREELQKILFNDVQRDMQTIEDRTGIKIVESKPLRVEKNNDLYSIVQEWIQISHEDSTPWRFEQCLIPCSKKIVQLVFLHEMSEGEENKTTLEQVKNSIIIKKDPSLWPSIRIENMGTIKCPPTMEIQDDTCHEASKGQKKYIFQQKGLNEKFPISFRQYVRLIINVTEGSPGDFYRISDKEIIENLSDEDLKQIQAYFLKNARNQDPGIDIIQVYEPKVVTLNRKYPAILIGYKRMSTIDDRSSEPVLVRVYFFTNWKYAYHIVASYRSAEEDLWREDLLKAVNSISLEKVY